MPTVSRACYYEKLDKGKVHGSSELARHCMLDICDAISVAWSQGWRLSIVTVKVLAVLTDERRF